MKEFTVLFRRTIPQSPRLMKKIYNKSPCQVKVNPKKLPWTISRRLAFTKYAARCNHSSQNAAKGKRRSQRVTNGDLGDLEPHSPRIQALLFDESVPFLGYTVLYYTHQARYAPIQPFTAVLLYRRVPRRVTRTSQGYWEARLSSVGISSWA
jgi:hypothetical protein